MSTIKNLLSNENIPWILKVHGTFNAKKEPIFLRLYGQKQFVKYLLLCFAVERKSYRIWNGTQMITELSCNLAL